MGSFPKEDTAPEKSRTALRRDGTTYYVPSLLHLAPTHEKIVPLLIRDLLQSKSPLEIYGTQGLQLHNEGYVLVGNYPIKKIKVFGRIMSYQVFETRDKASPTDIYTLFLEDFSGPLSSISVRLKAEAIRFPHALLKNDALIEVTGVMEYAFNHRRLQASNAKILGESNDFDIELSWWQRALAVRELLQTPWHYEASPQVSIPGGEDEDPKPPRKDEVFQEQKGRILIELSDSDSEQDSASCLSVTDSILLAHSRYPQYSKIPHSEECSPPVYEAGSTTKADFETLSSFRNESVRESQSSSTGEVIDLTGAS